MSPQQGIWSAGDLIELIAMILALPVIWLVWYALYGGAAVLLDKLFNATNTLEYRLVNWWESRKNVTR